MLPTSPKQQPPRDGRLYAAVPLRAWLDKRLSATDLRILIGVCGYLRRGASVAWVSQDHLATTASVTPQLIYRYITRLCAHGYLIQLAPARRLKLSAVYGVVFDPSNPPSRDDAEHQTQDTMLVSTHLQNDNKTQQVINNSIVPTAQLIVAWRGMVVDYQPDGIEPQHWSELSRSGCTPADLLAVHKPGRSLIGYYMAGLRQLLIGR